MYLGKQVEVTSGALGDRLDLPSSDLLTHGLIVGMTGSGKTGLAIALIEEALQQGIPVIAIDPKGDLGNLFLLFENLDGAAFAPWVDTEAARRAGKTVEVAGAEAAAAWKKGLAEWGLGGSDIGALKKAHDAVIYTPGSRSGIPLNMLESLAAPQGSFDSAAEELRDEIAGIVSGLLGLVGIEADPLQSRESILLSNLIESSWRSGKGLSLESLITGIADPPFEKLGALALESVYPRKERQSLMMALNNLLASPSFEAWREGEPLDVDAMLRAKDGRPKLSVVYTAHLSDAERLFVTALLLDKIKTWMRRQGGTSELRALVYMDEIFGYFPPHPANPPTKRPLLTLLKQARSQGVGVVLATQNPVDLDYKGLANIGTWMVGTLQTDQDRARLREGLLGAGVDAALLDRLLDGTRKRVFLLHDVHRPRPVLFNSRWAMSYLRGPLTREEIERLMATRRAARPEAARAPGAGPPVLPPPFKHTYLAKFGGEVADPYLLVKYAVRYKGSGETLGIRLYALDAPSAVEALEAEPVAVTEDALKQEGPASLRYAELPGFLDAAGARGIEKALKERLPDKLTLTLLLDPVTKSSSEPGESRDAFAARLSAGAGDDDGARLREKLDKKKRELDAARQALGGRKAETWAAVGSAILANIGLFTGKKRTVTGAGSVLSKNRMENSAEARVAALEAEVATLDEQLGALSKVDPQRFEERPVVPARSDVKVLRYDLVWVY